MGIGVMLASFGFFQGGTIGNVLSQWEQAGVFSYVLPFLLIFALVFGILTKTKIFSEKAVNAVIALAVALMALQFPSVSLFFAEIFPRLGIGLSVILVALITLGLFIDPDKNKGSMLYIFLAIGAIVMVVVFVNSAGDMGWLSNSWWSYNWSDNIGVIVIVIFVLVAIFSVLGIKPKKSTSTEAYRPPLVRD